MMQKKKNYQGLDQSEELETDSMGGLPDTGDQLQTDIELPKLPHTFDHDLYSRPMDQSINRVSNPFAGDKKPPTHKWKPSPVQDNLSSQRPTLINGANSPIVSPKRIGEF